MKSVSEPDNAVRTLQMTMAAEKRGKASKPVTVPENPNTPRTESQASIEWNRSKAWFQRKRWEGGGPEYIKLPGKRGGVLYPPEGLRSYFGGCLCRSTSESSIREAAHA